MKTTPIVVLVWGLAYFAIAGGILEVTWVEYVLSLVSVLLMLAATTQYQANQLMDILERSGKGSNA